MKCILKLILGIFLFIPLYTQAQTNYVTESGFYSSVLPRFSYDKSPFDQKTFTIAPNIGYRINKNYDILLSLEYLNHEQNVPVFDTSTDPGNFTNLTLSLMVGQTIDVLPIQKLGLRNQVGFSKSVPISQDELFSAFDLSPQGAFISSSLFKEVSIFNDWVIYPNAGLELSLNDFDNPFLVEEDFTYLERENNLFIDIGLDVKFPFFNVPLILQPSYKYSVANNNELADTNAFRFFMFFNF